MRYADMSYRLLLWGFDCRNIQTLTALTSLHCSSMFLRLQIESLKISTSTIVSIQVQSWHKADCGSFQVLLYTNACESWGGVSKPRHTAHCGSVKRFLRRLLLIRSWRPASLRPCLMAWWFWQRQRSLAAGIISLQSILLSFAACLPRSRSQLASSFHLFYFLVFFSASPLFVPTQLFYFVLFRASFLRFPTPLRILSVSFVVFVLFYSAFDLFFLLLFDSALFQSSLPYPRLAALLYSSLCFFLYSPLLFSAFGYSTLLYIHVIPSLYSLLFFAIPSIVVTGFVLAGFFPNPVPEKIIPLGNLFSPNFGIFKVQGGCPMEKYSAPLWLQPKKRVEFLGAVFVGDLQRDKQHLGHWNFIQRCLPPRSQNWFWIFFVYHVRLGVVPFCGNGNLFRKKFGPKKFIGDKFGHNHP